MEKTEAFIVGKHMEHFKNDYNLNWIDGPIHILGMHICKTEVESIKYNFEPRMKTIRTIFNMWKQRNLSLKGKVTVINILAASFIVYQCSALVDYISYYLVTCLPVSRNWELFVTW